MKMAEVSIVLLALVVIGGYIANIVSIFGLDFSSITGEHVVRIAGIFLAPIGAIAGFF